jgi:SAM-dependent methyltransferase
MTGTSAATAPRQDHPEILDDPGLDPVVVRRSMRDVARSNLLFGGRRAVLSELDEKLDRLPGHAILLDVGTGLGDIPAAAARHARRRGHAVFTIGLDASAALARESRARLDAVVVADAARLPFRDGSVHVTTCSQLLHHFPAEAAAAVVRELNRVTSRRVIVADIRRSRVAMAGLWLASFLLGFHPVSRHDGVASIRRGYTLSELQSLVGRALGRRVRVRSHPGFRVAASWGPQ